MVPCGRPMRAEPACHSRGFPELDYADEPLNWVARDPTPSQLPPPGPGVITGTDGFYDDKVRLSWSGIAGALEYVIYRNDTASSVGAAEIARVAAGTQNFNDETATAGIDYFYAVTAVMPGNEESAFSEWVRGERSAEETYRPDGLIGKRRVSKIGDGIHNTTGLGQIQQIRTKRRKVLRFFLALQNDGANAD